jgi:anti-sigma factor RsiW
MSERELLRELRGELSAEESAALRRRLVADPELRALERRLRTSWEALEPPPDPAVPAGFAARVMARAGEDRVRGMSWVQLPAWGKLASAAALAVGLVTGILTGVRGLAPAPQLTVEQPSGQVATIEEYLATTAASPAETYLAALEREDFATGDATEAR